MDLLAQFAFSILAAAIASYVTVQLSLRKFYREKWWERKLAAYTAVIESLHHMKAELDRMWEALLLHKDDPVDEAEDNARQAKYKAAHAEIRKNADIGEFLLSREVAERLRELERELDKAKGERTVDGFVDGSLFAVSSCLKDVKVLARADLGLGPTGRERVSNWLARKLASKESSAPAEKVMWTSIPVTSPPSPPRS